MLIRDLIDAGPPFVERAERFKDIKFDISTVMAIGLSNTISIGDFVAHLVPLSNLERVIEVFETLLDTRDLWKELDTVRVRSPRGGKTKMFESLRTSIYQNLSETFRLRHILAHELAPDGRLTPSQVHVLLLSTTLFGLSLDNVVLRMISTNREPSDPE